MKYKLFVVINGVEYEAGCSDSAGLTLDGATDALRQFRVATSGQLELVGGDLLAWSATTPLHFIAKKA